MSLTVRLLHFVCLKMTWDTRLTWKKVRVYPLGSTNLLNKFLDSLFGISWKQVDILAWWHREKVRGCLTLHLMTKRPQDEYWRSLLRQIMKNFLFKFIGSWISFEVLAFEFECTWQALAFRAASMLKVRKIAFASKLIHKSWNWPYIIGNAL